MGVDDVVLEREGLLGPPVQAAWHADIVPLRHSRWLSHWTLHQMCNPTQVIHQKFRENEFHLPWGHRLSHQPLPHPCLRLCVVSGAN